MLLVLLASFALGGRRDWRHTQMTLGQWGLRERALLYFLLELNLVQIAQGLLLHGKLAIQILEASLVGVRILGEAVFGTIVAVQVIAGAHGRLIRVLRHVVRFFGSTADPRCVAHLLCSGWLGAASHVVIAVLLVSIRTRLVVVRLLLGHVVWVDILAAAIRLKCLRLHIWLDLLLLLMLGTNQLLLLQIE